MFLNTAIFFFMLTTIAIYSYLSFTILLGIKNILIEIESQLKVFNEKSSKRR